MGDPSRRARARQPTPGARGRAPAARSRRYVEPARLRVGAGAHSAVADVVDRPLAELEAPRSRTSRAHARVVTFDGRGNGRSDRPAGVERYVDAEFVGGCPRGARRHRHGARGRRRHLASGRSGPRCSPETTRSASSASCCIAPDVVLAPGRPERLVHGFEDVLDTDEGWAKFNVHYWARAYQELPRVLLRRPLPDRAALDETGRGFDRLGPRDHAGGAGRHASRGYAAATRMRSARRARASAARPSCCTAMRMPSAASTRPWRSPRPRAARS